MQARAAADDSRTRARILAAAEQRFAAFGYRRTGISEIAREAGVAPGTLYRYFENKEEIFRAVMRDGLTNWIDVARRVLAEPGTALERLARLAQASIDFNRENSLVNSVYRRDGEIIFAPLLEELHEQLVTENVAMIADVIRDGIREGDFRDVDPERAAFVLFTGGDVLSSQTHYPYQEILPLYSDIVMNGLMRR
jgi:TetR/AcrR family fatty acid metabolism transcriptional regulator